MLNTSFNENEPIVNTPAEALNCFLRTRMDRLVMGKSCSCVGSASRSRGVPIMKTRARRWRRWRLATVCLVVAGELAVRRLAETPAGGTGSLYDIVVSQGSRFKLRPSTRLRVPERYGTITYTTTARAIAMSSTTSLGPARSSSCSAIR